jgi:5-formyltetrahydrofolate cyclo-ligase
MDHPTIRQLMQRKRRSMSATEVIVASQRICQKILKHPAYQHARCVAIYSAVHGEPSLHAIAENCWQDPNKTCFLPCIQPHHRLRFAPIDANSTYLSNGYGIPEPNGPLDAVTGQDLDCVLLPLTAFNDYFDRLGSGMGYYDRSFAFRKQQRTPILLGVAYQWQRCQDFVAKAHDIPCDDIITDA